MSHLFHARHAFGGGFVSLKVKSKPQQQLSKSGKVLSAKTRSPGYSPLFLCLRAWRPLINLEEIHPGMAGLHPRSPEQSVEPGE